MRDPLRSVLLLAVALVAGCLGVATPRPGERLELAPDQVLVFGRLCVSDRGRDLFPRLRLGLGASGADPDVKLSLMQVETGKKAVQPAIDDDGTFWWILPRGTYLVFHTPPGPVLRNEVLAAFQAPPGASAVYVGTLALEIESEGGSGPPVPYSTVRVETGDDFESARAALSERHPGLGEPPARALMFTDPAFAGLFDDYSRARCERILAVHGLEPRGS